MIVTGLFITSKYRWVALAASFVIASSQPIESIGHRRLNATPKNATSVPADIEPPATWTMPKNRVRPNAISGMTMTEPHNLATTAALVSSVARRPRADAANRRE